MPNQEDKFVSYIESRIQDNGELYARFHLGTFVEGQALTIANALRRTLLSEIPGFVVTSVDIDNASHEFSTLLGIHESVLNILLNLKRMAVMSRSEKSFNYFSVSPPYQFNAHINLSGPGTVTAANIKFPPELTPVFPDHHFSGRGRCQRCRLWLVLGPVFYGKPSNFSPIIFEVARRGWSAKCNTWEGSSQAYTHAKSHWNAQRNRATISHEP